MAGCSHTSVMHKADDRESSAMAPDYSLIFYVHGDDDYLYHNSEGEPIQANQHALQKALSVARNAESGRVIIFHRQSERKVLGLFPRKTSRFLIYQKGERQLSLKYRDSENGSFMGEEIRLYHTYANQITDKDHTSHFFYFGHEIPLNSVDGYHESVPEDLWSTTLFADEVSNFLPNEEYQFGLVALSTCSNGTPAMVSQLAPLSETLLASPQNLHLSHLDVAGLEALETNAQISDNPSKLAKMLAEDTFSRLSDDLQTDITLAVYDLSSTSDTVSDLRQIAENYHKSNPINFNSDNTDCAELLPVDLSLYSQGVTTYFKPARFGRRASSRSHSGWGCKPAATTP